MNGATKPENARPNSLSPVAAAAFVLWLSFINVFYYVQFRALFVARFGSWIHRWR